MRQETIPAPANFDNEALFVIETLQSGTLNQLSNGSELPGGGGSSNCNCNSNSNGSSEEMLA